jgi:hypothetical protein
VFEQARTVHALDGAATAIGKKQIFKEEKRGKNTEGRYERSKWKENKKLNKRTRE